MPAEYKIAENMAELLEGASRESVRRLFWQMENGPTLIAKERAATMLAKLCVPRPPQRVELTGKMDLTMTAAETLRAKRMERLQAKTEA